MYYYENGVKRRFQSPSLNSSTPTGSKEGKSNFVRYLIISIIVLLLALLLVKMIRR